MKKGQTSIVHFISRFGVSIAGFVTNLYVANKLGSEALGTYFLAISVVAWVALFGNLGIQESVKKRLSEVSWSWSHATTGIVIQTSLFFGVGILLIVFRNQINRYVGAPVAYFLVVMIGVQLFYDLVIAVLEGLNKVHLASILDPIWWVGRAGVQISLVALGLGVVGLFSGYIIAGVVALVVGWHLTSITWERPTREHAIDLIAYARYSWLRPIKGRTFLSMDTIILGFFVGNNLIGIYEISWNVASILAIFGTSITKTLFPEISNSASQDHPNEVRRMVTAALSYAGLFLIPGLVGAILLGETILKIYGNEFTAGYYILLVLTFSRLVMSYESQLTNSLDAMDHAEETFRINSVFIIVNILLNIALVWQYGWIGAAVASAFTSTLSLVLSHRVLIRYVDYSIPSGEISKQVISAAVMGGFVYVAKAEVGTSIPAALLLIVCGAGIYFGILLLISKQFKNTVKSNVPRRFDYFD